MAAQFPAAASHRCHDTTRFVAPVQVPTFRGRLLPLFAVPATDGATTLTGAAGGDGLDGKNATENDQRRLVVDTVPHDATGTVEFPFTWVKPAPVPGSKPTSAPEPLPPSSASA